MPDSVLAQLYTIDRNVGHTIQNTATMLNNDWRDTYLVSPLIEEEITSSQLEGASTTRKVAKEMLQTHRKPCDISEKMIKAIILHFMLAYDHPFTDGNGRTARALFYWCLLRNGYWLSEFISISSIIKQAPSHYAKALLYTETDDNDITYFILHQLGVIVKAFDSFKAYLEKQICEVKQAEVLLHSGNELYRNLNHRQVVLIKNALKHLGHHYTIQAHRSAHNITYQTARNDLLVLDELGLFKKDKWGRAFVFSAVSGLKAKLKA